MLLTTLQSHNSLNLGKILATAQNYCLICQLCLVYGKIMLLTQEAFSQATSGILWIIMEQFYVCLPGKTNGCWADWLSTTFPGNFEQEKACQPYDSQNVSCTNLYNLYKINLISSMNLSAHET